MTKQELQEMINGRFDKGLYYNVMLDVMSMGEWKTVYVGGVTGYRFSWDEYKKAEKVAQRLVDENTWGEKAMATVVMNVTNIDGHLHSIAVHRVETKGEK